MSNEVGCGAGPSTFHPFVESLLSSPGEDWVDAALDMQYAFQKAMNGTICS